MKYLWLRMIADLHARAGGPFTFRLILQPLMAGFIAFRAGRRDAQELRPPYVWGLFWVSRPRSYLLREGWRDIGRVFLLAILVDVIYELIFEGWFYPLETVTVAVTVAIAPYLVVRSLVNPAVRSASQYQTKPRRK